MKTLYTIVFKYNAPLPKKNPAEATVEAVKSRVYLVAADTLQLAIDAATKLEAQVDLSSTFASANPVPIGANTTFVVA